MNVLVVYCYCTNAEVWLVGGGSVVMRVDDWLFVVGYSVEVVVVYLDEGVGFVCYIGKNKG